MEVNCTKFLANCYGYPGEDKNIVKYNSQAVLEIETFI
jgi:hypothetical protein